MEYDNHTWRLLTSGSPVVSVPLANKSLPSSHISEEALSDISITASVPICNSFSSLPEDFGPRSEAYVTAFLSDERIKGRLQQRFEHMCQLWKEAITLHRAHGHPNNRILLLNLKQLKRQILAVSYGACRAGMGKRDNKISAVIVTKRRNIAEQKKVAKVQRNLSAQQNSDPISVTTST